MTARESRGWQPTDGFPVHRARFKGGRVHHRVKDTGDDYWMETACGKSGLAATGYPNRPPSACPVCYPGTPTSKEPQR